MLCAPSDLGAASNVINSGMNQLRVYILIDVYIVLYSVDFCVCVAMKRSQIAYLKTFHHFCSIVWLRPRES